MKTLVLFLLLITGVAYGEDVPNAEVLGWKFNHAQGMSTKAGIVTEFPKVAVDRDGNTRDNAILPTAEELAQWKVEYVAWKAAQVPAKPETQVLREEIDRLNAQMKEVAKTIPAVGTVKTK